MEGLEKMLRGDKEEKLSAFYLQFLVKLNLEFKLEIDDTAIGFNSF